MHTSVSQNPGASRAQVPIEWADDAAVRTEAVLARRRLNQTLWLFLGLGALVTILNLRWPLARNALNYAKAALMILHDNFDLFAVVRDPSEYGGKPIFFSLLAAPFVWLIGAVRGTEVVSAFGTAFFLYTVTLALPRLNAKVGIHPRYAPLEFVFVAFNPLVVYQFWSGYPDALLAGFVLLAFVLIDIVATEPERDTRWHIIGLALAVCGAMMTKLYGAILVVACPLYLLVNLKRFWVGAVCRRSKVTLLVGSFAMVSGMLVAAELGLNPLIRMEHASGLNGYSLGMAPVNIKDAMSMLIFALILTFNVGLLFSCARQSWHQWSVAPAMFIAVYVLGLLPFSGTGYNMRYFLPVFPFVVPILVGGGQPAAPLFRTMLLGSYGVLAAILTLCFNVSPVAETAEPLVSRLHGWWPNLENWLDNLRLPIQMELKSQIDTINAGVPRGGTLYWSSDYYGKTIHGLAHELGVRSDINVQYVLEPADVPENKDPIFLTLFTSLVPPEEFWPSPEWATVKVLGHGVFRLDPVSVHLRAVGDEFVVMNQAVRLRLEIESKSDIRISNVEVLDGGSTLQLDRSTFPEIVVPNPVRGRHEYVARVTYGGSEVATSRPEIVYVGVYALERRATSVGDLMDEFGDGSAIVPKDLMFLDEEERAIGIRFEDIRVPRGAHIADAFLKFTAAGAALGGATTLELRAELAPNAEPIRMVIGSVSNRALSQSRVTWHLGKWRTVGSQERSPSLAALLEEIFSQQEWESGNAVLLSIRVTGPTRLLKIAPSTDAPALYIQVR